MAKISIIELGVTRNFNLPFTPSYRFSAEHEINLNINSIVKTAIEKVSNVSKQYEYFEDNSAEVSSITAVILSIIKTIYQYYELFLDYLKK